MRQFRQAHRRVFRSLPGLASRNVFVCENWMKMTPKNHRPVKIGLELALDPLEAARSYHRHHHCPRDQDQQGTEWETCCASREHTPD